MSAWLSSLVFVLVASLGARIWYRSWQRRRVALRRRVEAPKSRYSSAGERNQEDRQSWGEIDAARLHPLNRDEVRRLLACVDAEGITALTPADRLFLDNMTLPRRG